MKACSNCGIEVLTTWKCNSCSYMVCDGCMPVAGSDCFECLDAFPAPPSTNQGVETFNVDLPYIAFEEGDTEEAISTEDPLFQQFRKAPVTNFQVGDYGYYSQTSHALDSRSSLKASVPILGVVDEDLVDGVLNSFPQTPRVFVSEGDGSVQSNKTLVGDTLGKAGMMNSGGTCDAATCAKALECFDMHMHVTSKYKENKKGTTTMMICNIPCRVGYEELISAVDHFGFHGIYEFVHLPYRYGQSESNLGYGFINFFCSSDAETFALAFEGYRFPGRGSAKACSVKVASCQGYNASYRRMSRVLRQRQKM